MPEGKTLEIELVPASRQKHFEKLMKRVRRTIYANNPTEGEYLNMALCILKTSKAARNIPAGVIGKLVESISLAKVRGQEAINIVSETNMIQKGKT